MTSTNNGVGELISNVEAKIVNETGTQEVSVGDRGEFWVRGPNVMKGYWNKPEATRDTLTEDGWLKTGDIVYRDNQGIIFIVDRMKVRPLYGWWVRCVKLTLLRNSLKSRAIKLPRLSSKACY